LQAQQIDEQGQQPHQQVKGGQVPTFNTSSQTHTIHNQHSPNKEKRNTQHGISLQNKVTIPAWLASGSSWRCVSSVYRDGVLPGGMVRIVRDLITRPDLFQANKKAQTG